MTIVVQDLSGPIINYLEAPSKGLRYFCLLPREGMREEG